MSTAKDPPPGPHPCSRRDLEPIIERLGARLRAAGSRLPDETLVPVSEALTAAYYRGLDRGICRARDEVQEQLNALGLEVRIVIQEDEASPP